MAVSQGGGGRSRKMSMTHSDITRTELLGRPEAPPPELETCPDCDQDFEQGAKCAKCKKYKCKSCMVDTRGIDLCMTCIEDLWEYWRQRQYEEALNEVAEKAKRTGNERDLESFMKLRRERL
jgi:hypothetical protein